MEEATAIAGDLANTHSLVQFTLSDTSVIFVTEILLTSIDYLKGLMQETISIHEIWSP